MYIERTEEMGSPERLEILTSPLSRTSPLYGYRGKEKYQEVDGLPWGLLNIQDKGISFFNLSMDLVKSVDKKEGRRLALDALDEFSAKLGSDLVPFGGVITTIGFAAAKKVLLNPEVELFDDLETRILNDPKTFVIPYTDIVEAQYEQVGGFFNKRDYITLTVKTTDGKVEHFCISAEKDHLGLSTATLFLLKRFVMERQELISKIINKFTNLDEKRVEVFQKYGDEYGEKFFEGKDLYKQYLSELSQFTVESLKSSGKPFREIQFEVRDKLMHFKPLMSQPDCEDLKGYFSAKL